ncbi:hypothetical protein IMX26_05765 [Clostridium sp. 'deep sea']|uniref:hypothetical protein n=1 Tax=Clostridium sp. 'deep sea' TaxID=2779445 RepID=UPI001896705E|nr:hypothetical protein [Clostridium sp. 'deep sea']QOR36319.1 hypothetical protein IMX26_05765 [Clostridium sp. 'deep sea']
MSNSFVILPDTSVLFSHKKRKLFNDFRQLISPLTVVSLKSIPHFNIPQTAIFVNDFYLLVV